MKEKFTEFDCSYPCGDVCTRLSHAKSCPDYRPFGKLLTTRLKQKLESMRNETIQN